MKKYKVHFSLTNLFSESQSQVVQLQNRVKLLMGSATLGTWLADNASHAMFVGLAGMIADTLLACLYFEEKK